MAGSLEDLSKMLRDLKTVSRRVGPPEGLKMNMGETNIMTNAHVAPLPVYVGNNVIEVAGHSTST